MSSNLCSNSTFYFKQTTFCATFDDYVFAKRQRLQIQKRNPSQTKENFIFKFLKLCLGIWYITVFQMIKQTVFHYVWTGGLLIVHILGR